MMIQRLTTTLSILSFCGFIAIITHLISSSQKVVYVSTEKLLDSYKGMNDARKAYQDKSQVWIANIDTLRTEVRQQILEYDKYASKLSLLERKQRQEQIRFKQRQLSDYQAAIDAQAQLEHEKLTGEALERINAYLQRYGKEHGYRIVIAANEYGNIAYADEGLDITDNVLKGLNDEYVKR